MNRNLAAMSISQGSIDGLSNFNGQGPIPAISNGVLNQSTPTVIKHPGDMSGNASLSGGSFRGGNLGSQSVKSSDNDELEAYEDPFNMNFRLSEGSQSLSQCLSEGKGESPKCGS